MRSVNRSSGDYAGISIWPQPASGKSDVHKTEHVRGDGRIGVGAEGSSRGALIERLEGGNLYGRAEGASSIGGLCNHDGVGHARGRKLPPGHVDISVHRIHRNRGALACYCSLVNLNGRTPSDATIRGVRKHQHGRSSVVLLRSEER